MMIFQNLQEENVEWRAPIDPDSSYRQLKDWHNVNFHTGEIITKREFVKYRTLGTRPVG
ncbi:hypothetical protein Golob_024301 [Gossypium lobatum]|uniref:Uncharacterized protein n=1 Tax=Gossypium lobatum TaxID=34289 RepID=A0A7J8NDX4_9ROSI|nr:hypothetical protein [Gossypium lobatum]